MNEDGLLSAVVALERVPSWLAAVQARVLSEFAARRATGSDGGEFAGEEIAAVLRVAPRTGVKRLDRALELTGRLPQTLQSMERGEATVEQARVLAEETAHLPPDVAHQVEAAVLPGASAKTPGQLRRAAKEAVFQVDAAAAEHREAQARAERKVVISALPDGMAELYALLPAQDAIALYSSLDEAARQARRAGDPRSMDQLRADTLAALAGTPGGRASVQVILTDATLARRDDAPAELVGYGPISAATARRIAGDGIWQALHTDETGALNGVGRHRYRPSAPLAELIRSRDRTCRFPGCAHPARACDIDHTTRFPAGATEPANLASLCRRHHRLKTGGESKGGGWSVTQHPGGSLTWRSPTGRSYLTNPRRLTDTGPPAAPPTPASGDPPF